MIKKRLFNLDLIRTIGLLLIIYNHALNTVWDATNYNYWMNAPIFEKSMIVFGYYICRLGVPLFLMITGSLILNKKIETGEDIKKFYKHNLLNLVIVIMIWNVIYCVFDSIYYDKNFSIKNLMYVLLFMKKSPMPHMWYMSMIVGMYIALPYISTIVKKFKFKEIIIPLIIGILCSYIIPNTKILLTFFDFNGTNIKTILDISFLGGAYGIYIILGYYIYNKKILEKIKTKYILLGIIVGMIISIAFQIFAYQNASKYIVYYNFVGILLSGTLLFEFLRRFEKTKRKNIENILCIISKYSLGIYFVHRPLLFLFKKYFILDFLPFINVIIYYICSIIISYIIVQILSKINILKKYLLLVKD